jgi:hypothetical protein
MIFKFTQIGNLSILRKLFLSFVLVQILVFSFNADAQNLKLKEVSTGKDITGDTIILQSKYTTYKGVETLDLPLIVENTSSSAIEVGARKIEYEKLQKDVEHTMCFAGFCYDTSTYVSPFHVNLKAGSSDTSFTAHYLFDNKVHIRCVNHIAYVFYDVKNPSDSAIVYVNYNTVAKVGVKEEASKNNLISDPYPNPSKDLISFNRNHAKGTITLKITNLLGEVQTVIEFPSNENVISINTSSMQSGIYYFTFYESNELINSKKIIVLH